MIDSPNMDDWLDRMGQRSFRDEGEALGAVAEAVDAINREMQAESIAGSIGAVRAEMIGGMDVTREDRLRSRIKKLYDMCKKIADEWNASFTITLGFPLGVSVSFGFQLPKS
jgi:hypothetical protein